MSDTVLRARKDSKSREFECDQIAKRTKGALSHLKAQGKADQRLAMT
jgi:hypothetical protein